MENSKIKKLFEENFNITFKDTSIIERALMHTSYVNENNAKGKKLHSYERLEFLGDSILNLATTAFLFKKFPDKNEGELTKIRAQLVCETMLAKVSRKLQIGSLIYLGRGEKMSGGAQKDAILADVFESVLAAIYFEHGYNKCVEFLNETLFPCVDEEHFLDGSDFKTQLQELVQGGTKRSVTYKIIEESGPSHDPTFKAVAQMDSKIILGEGVGKSKKDAEQQAAKQALLKMASENK